MKGEKESLTDDTNGKGEVFVNAIYEKLRLSRFDMSPENLEEAIIKLSDEEFDKLTLGVECSD